MDQNVASLNNGYLNCWEEWLFDRQVPILFRGLLVIGDTLSESWIIPYSYNSIVLKTLLNLSSGLRRLEELAWDDRPDDQEAHGQAEVRLTCTWQQGRSWSTGARRDHQGAKQLVRWCGKGGAVLYRVMAGARVGYTSYICHTNSALHFGSEL
jgi:hypothetical protein